jgi:site-specific DNA-cytosine methylase
MKTFASLFSGGGGADLGAIDAGLKPIWGVEYVPEIAEWYGDNIGHPAIVKSILTVNFRELESPFWLHASPPCVTASVANVKAGESLMDAALAAAVCEAIDALLPEWFSLENVGGYRSYASYAAIKDALADNGYRMVEGVLNSADYGVPQTRRRLVLVASRVAAPVMPRPTHSDKEAAQMQLSMFDAPLLPWVGWYEAIADLLPGCPDSKLAEWQLKRLPESLSDTLIGDQTSTGEWAAMNRPAGVPAYVVDTRPAGNHKALLMGSNIAGTSRQSETRCFTLAADNSEGGRVRAVLYPPNFRTWEIDTPPLPAGKPAYTLNAIIGNKTAMPTVLQGATVKRLTPRCLFRLQGVPDSYRIPDDRRLAGRIAGNMVCPPVMAAIVEAQNENR